MRTTSSCARRGRRSRRTSPLPPADGRRAYSAMNGAGLSVTEITLRGVPARTSADACGSDRLRLLPARYRSREVRYPVQHQAADREAAGPEARTMTTPEAPQAPPPQMPPGEG